MIISEEAFKGCSSMKGNLTISSSVTTIKENAFDGTNFSNVAFLGSANIECSNSIGLSNITIVEVPNKYESNNFCSYKILVHEEIKKKKKLPVGGIVGIVIACVIVAVCIIIGIIIIRKKIHSKNNNETSRGQDDQNSDDI